MDRKQQIEQQIRALYAELHVLKAAEDDKENASVIGKCYRVRNCYSSPQSDDDYWWLYVRVTGTKDGNLTVLKFQDDKQGRLTIESDGYSVRQSLDSYEEIGVGLFMGAWRAFTAKISALQVSA